MISIKIQNGKKFYVHKNIKYRALYDISFTINEGDYVFIEGKKDSGKTTLLNILGGIVSLDEGEYFFDNIRLKDFNKRELYKFINTKFSYIALKEGLINELNLFENMELPLIYLKIPKIERKKIILKNLELLNLEKLAYENVKKLSLIDIQKSCICRAISKGSNIILFDDLVLNKEILEIISYLNKNGFTIISTGEKLIREIKANNIIQIKDGMINEVTYVHR